MLPLNLHSLRARVKAGETFTYLPFYGHRPRADGDVDASCLSQWYYAPFQEGGIPYPTAEHWMMAGKARLFDDSEMLAAILAASSPSEAKQLGRRVRGFDHNRWEAARFDIVVAGNEAKFGQNEALCSFLLATGETVLVEAAPRDRIWGIGLGRSNPATHDPMQWHGRNLLGFALMVVRERLRRDHHRLGAEHTPDFV